MIQEKVSEKYKNMKPVAPDSASIKSEKELYILTARTCHGKTWHGHREKRA